MTERFPISQQITALATARNWISSAAVSYLPKSVGARPNEIEHVQQALAAAEVSLEWLATNRPAFLEWLQTKREAEESGGADA